jgi:hypothetical protein
MRDFDEARKRRQDKDRSFKIGGETFVMKPGVRPEALADYEKIGPDSTPTETLAIIDGIVLSMIDGADGGHDRYVKVRESEDDPVTLGDMQELVEWLMEEQTARPTELAPASGGGRRRTATPSTVASS